jgi:ParB family chromosome partitioning protein
MDSRQTEYQSIPMAKIDEPPHQLRGAIDPERLGELADSMAAEGLHQPIGLRTLEKENRYEIIWGHRRFLAARLLQWQFIQARTFPEDFDPLLAAISENLQRVDLNPVEEARAVRKLLEQGRAMAEVARVFRRSHAWVATRLEILGFHEDIIEAIQSNALKLSVAQALQDIDHAGYRAELIREALRTGATGTTAELWRQHYIADRDRIISNNMVLEEVLARREAWVIYVPCQGCHNNVDYRETEAWRFCVPCSRELRTQLDQAQHESNGSQSQSSDTALMHAQV